MARRLFVLLVPFALLAGACSSGGDTKAADVTTTTTTSQAPSSSTSSTTEQPSTTQAAPTSTTTPPCNGIPLSGSVGSGTVTWSASPQRSEFCYRITVKGVGTPTAAHVHRTTGEEVLALQAPPADGTVNTCSATDALFVEEVQSRPGNFFIDVHGPKGVLKATLR